MGFWIKGFIEAAYLSGIEQTGYVNVLGIFKYLGMVDLQFYISFRCTAEWFIIFIDYPPFKVITK